MSVEESHTINSCDEQREEVQKDSEIQHVLIRSAGIDWQGLLDMLGSDPRVRRNPGHPKLRACIPR